MIDIINTSELKNGDTYRTLDRAGDYVLIGSISELIDCKEYEDARGTIWRHVGEGEYSYAQDTGARAPFVGR